MVVAVRQFLRRDRRMCAVPRSPEAHEQRSSDPMLSPSTDLLRRTAANAPLLAAAQPSASLRATSAALLLAGVSSAPLSSPAAVTVRSVCGTLPRASLCGRCRDTHRLSVASRFWMGGRLPSRARVTTPFVCGTLTAGACFVCSKDTSKASAASRWLATRSSAVATTTHAA